MTDLPEPAVRLSYSQLNSFTSCPEQYRLERIERVPQVPAWWFIGGNAVHTATEERDFRDLGVDVPARTFADIFEQETLLQEEKSGVDRKDFRAGGRSSQKWPNKENRDWWLAEGPSMVDRWTTWRRRSPWDIWITPTGEPAIELELDLTILDGYAGIKMFTDRVLADQHGQLIVLDLKTGASKPVTPRQMGTYKLGIEAQYPGVTVGFGTFWDARGGSTGPVYPLNQYSLRRLEWQYGAFQHARETGLYIPNPSRCGSCGVKDWCYEVDGPNAHLVRPPWVSADEWAREQRAEESA